jgi:hypothetical protein
VLTANEWYEKQAVLGEMFRVMVSPKFLPGSSIYPDFLLLSAQLNKHSGKGKKPLARAFSKYSCLEKKCGKR